jgi:hypothetical protein
MAELAVLGSRQSVGSEEGRARRNWPIRYEEQEGNVQAIRETEQGWIRKKQRERN